MRSLELFAAKPHSLRGGGPAASDEGPAPGQAAPQLAVLRLGGAGAGAAAARGAGGQLRVLQLALSPGASEAGSGGLQPHPGALSLPLGHGAAPDSAPMALRPLRRGGGGPSAPLSGRLAPAAAGPGKGPPRRPGDPGPGEGPGPGAGDPALPGGPGAGAAQRLCLRAAAACAGGPGGAEPRREDPAPRAAAPSVPGLPLDSGDLFSAESPLVQSPVGLLCPAGLRRSGEPL